MRSRPNHARPSPMSSATRTAQLDAGAGEPRSTIREIKPLARGSRLSVRDVRRQREVCAYS